MIHPPGKLLQNSRRRLDCSIERELPSAPRGRERSRDCELPSSRGRVGSEAGPGGASASSRAGRRPKLLDSSISRPDLHLSSRPRCWQRACDVCDKSWAPSARSSEESHFSCTLRGSGAARMAWLQSLHKGYPACRPKTGSLSRLRVPVNSSRHRCPVSLDS